MDMVFVYEDKIAQDAAGNYYTGSAFSQEVRRLVLMIVLPLRTRFCRTSRKVCLCWSTSSHLTVRVRVWQIPL